MIDPSLTAVDLVICARWVVPVEPAGVVLDHHAIAIDAGRIVDLLPAAEAAGRYRAAEWLDRPGHVLIPGLVNAHTHAAMTLLRGYADDLPLERWLADHIWPAEGRWLSPDFVHAGAELAMLEMLGGGTTAFMDMYLFPEAIAGLAVEHGYRAAVGMVVLDQPTAWANGPEDCLQKGLALHDQYRGHPLVNTVFAPHAPYSVADAGLKRVRMLADELDRPVQMHVHETAAEVAGSIAALGVRPLERFDRLGLLSERFMAVHATQLDDAEIALLATRRVSVVHCPNSNLKLASGSCPTGRLLEAGVNVALGTDGAASNNRLDMFAEMRAAALQAKHSDNDAASVPAATALRMATLNGARALGLGERIGSLERGKEADLVCVDLDDPATCPVHNVVSQLVYAASSHQVSDVWIAGRRLLDQRRPSGMDRDGILARATGWGARIHAR